MREHVVMLDVANDPVLYPQVIERLKAQGWRYEMKAVLSDIGAETGDMAPMLAEPCYWVVINGAWMFWQWEPGETPHPGWVRAMSAPPPSLPRW